MNAHPILLQMKYARIVALFAKNAQMSMQDALRFFYHAETYQRMREGISDMHCRSDAYLAEALWRERNDTHDD